MGLEEGWKKRRWKDGRVEGWKVRELYGWKKEAQSRMNVLQQYQDGWCREKGNDG